MELPPLDDVFAKLSGAVLPIAIPVATLMIVWAGFNYLTAAGNQEKVTNANHMLIYAVVAIAVAIIAKGVPGIIGGILTTSTFTGCP